MTKKTAAYWGRKAEEAAARKFGLDRVGNKWYDATSRKTGQKFQVKATRPKLASGASGSFRFWKRDHDLLKKHRGSYVLVLYDPSNKSRPILKVERVPPSKVGRIANWYASGHKGKGVQSKVRWDRLL